MAKAIYVPTVTQVPDRTSRNYRLGKLDGYKTFMLSFANLLETHDSLAEALIWVETWLRANHAPEQADSVAQWRKMLEQPELKA